MAVSEETSPGIHRKKQKQYGGTSAYLSVCLSKIGTGSLQVGRQIWRTQLDPVGLIANRPAANAEMK